MFSKISTDESGINFTIHFEYNADIVAKLKNHFPHSSGRKFNPFNKYWEVPIREDVVELIKSFSEMYGFDIKKSASEAMEKIVNEKKTFIELSYKKDDTEKMEIKDFKIDLFPYQRSGVKYAVRKNGIALLGDEMGLGKTFQALGTVQILNGFPLLIVCPASLKYQWQSEINKALPDKSVFIVNGRNNKYETLMADIIIVNYEILESNLNTLLQCMKFESVIFDEGYKIKNQKSKRTKAALEIAENCKHKMILNGTPISNHPLDLASQLEILGLLDKEFGGFFEFGRKYCAGNLTEFGWDFTGASNLEELNNKLRSLCMVRRNQAEVLPELPPILRAVIPVEISNRAEYWKAEKEFLNWLREMLENEKLIPNEIKNIPDAEQRERTKRIYIANKIARANSAEAIVKLNCLRSVVIEGKLNSIHEFMDSIIENNQKSIIFLWHTKPIREIQRKYAEQSAGTIYGGIPAQNREDYKIEFQENPEKLFIIGNLNAMGYGLNLTAARNVVFCELGWTPGEHSQAEKRAHRIGTDHPVNVYYLLAKDTLEEKIYNILAQKRNINRIALGDTTEETIEEITGDTEITVASELISQYIEKFETEEK